MTTADLAQTIDELENVDEIAYSFSDQNLGANAT